MDCKKANFTSLKTKPTIIYYQATKEDSKNYDILSRALIALSILLLIASIAFAINAFIFRLTSHDRIKSK
jgi:hypothetical protein